jgi:hypothetical protein
MTDFADLLARLTVTGPLPADPLASAAGPEPLGAAWLARRRHGLDLAAHGYVEQEYLISGDADDWTWDDTLTAVPRPAPRFTTRVLVRRPADAAAFSGTVQLEPHHPDEDRALTWGMIAPWIVASGHAHVGVTQHPETAADLVAWDPQRYAPVAIAASGQRWDIVALAAAAAASGLIPAFAGLDVRRVVMSGWSMTGTFCRTFLGEGFHERCALSGRPVVSGYVIAISSGGAGRAGYASLRDGTALPAGDPRRTPRAPGVPVIELLSEGESETHGSVLRPDADGPADRYRLYQVAGTGHMTSGLPAQAGNRIQVEERGAPHLLRDITQRPSDARMDLVARAVFELLERWLSDGVVPPRAQRFRFDPAGAVRGMMTESRPLARDADGNVRGGLRTPWTEVPAAAYLPHSTPAPGRCQPAAHAPYSDPALLADLIAHADPFPAQELERRYGDYGKYLGQLEDTARSLAAAGWLLEADLPEHLAGVRAHGVSW